MKKRYNEEKVVKILQEGERSGKVTEVCRKYGVSEGTFYRWRHLVGDRFFTTTGGLNRRGRGRPSFCGASSDSRARPSFLPPSW